MSTNYKLFWLKFKKKKSAFMCRNFLYTSIVPHYILKKYQKQGIFLCNLIYFSRNVFYIANVFSIIFVFTNHHFYYWIITIVFLEIFIFLSFINQTAMYFLPIFFHISTVIMTGYQHSISILSL